MSKKLLFPEDVRDFFIRRFNNQHRKWLAGEGAWPLQVSLGVPTEQDMTANSAAIRERVGAWQAWKGVGKVRWEERQWPRLGTQTLPVQFELSSAEEVAFIAGQTKRWATAVSRYAQMVENWPALAGNSALQNKFNVLADYSAVDFARLVALLRWLDSNPRSNMTLRQLPVEGLDTKWIETRTAVVTGLFKEIRGVQSEGDFFDVCGLRKPAHRIRIRILCPILRGKVGGLCDIEAPVDELALLPISPSRAIIVENLDTGLALPDIPSTVAVMKLGNAVGALAALPWLGDTRAVYWGDIDTHGYAILNRARQALPIIKSVLMDEATLLAHRPLWGQEPIQCSELELSALDERETAVYRGLRANSWGQKVRFEQERVPWDEAIFAVRQAIGVSAQAVFESNA
jgi:hypothetical protein